jgi:hypothetical protein
MIIDFNFGQARTFVLGGVFLALLTACPTGELGENEGEGPYDAGLPPPAADAGNEIQPGPDAGQQQENPVLEDGTATLSGTTKVFGTGQTMSNSQVETFGVTPLSTTTSDANGAYSLDVIAGGVFWAKTFKDTYLATLQLVEMPAEDYTKTLYGYSQGQLDQAATAYGKTVIPTCGTLIVSVVDASGNPVEGATGLSLVGPVSAEGPYFLGPDAAGQAGLTATGATGRAIFFNVCQTGTTFINSNVDVSVALNEVNYDSSPITVRFVTGGVTLAKMSAYGNGQAPPPPPINDPIDYATQIYPLFGSLYCTACHTTGGQAEGSGLLLDQGAEAVWNSLMAEGEYRVNLQYPDQSLVLTKPLLEDPPDHPNAAFQSNYDPNYVLVKSWIEQGAPYGFGEPPPIVVEVAFDADVYPLFQQALGGRGCTACHNAADLSGGLDLTGGADVVYQRLANYNYYNVNYPELSEILTYPKEGPDAGHPVRVVANENDPDYQTIYQWILQGAVYEGIGIVDPNLPTNVDFTTQVWPHFGAKGCTGCHSGGTPDGNLDLQAGPEEVSTNISTRLTAGDPSASAILQKPYAGNAAVAHGGNKPIPNDADPMYRYLAGWITEGAVFVAPTPVDFETQIVPFFNDPNIVNEDGDRCIDCHGNSGGLSLDGTPDEIYDELVVEQADRAIAYDPDGSLIITSTVATFIGENHAGGRFVNNQTYDFYIYVARWLYEGAYRVPQ